MNGKMKKLLQDVDLCDERLPFFDNFREDCDARGKYPNLKDYIFWLYWNYWVWQKLVKNGRYYFSFGEFMIGDKKNNPEGLSENPTS